MLTTMMEPLFIVILWYSIHSRTVCATSVQLGCLLSDFKTKESLCFILVSYYPFWVFISLSKEQHKLNKIFSIEKRIRLKRPHTLRPVSHLSVLPAYTVKHSHHSFLMMTSKHRVAMVAIKHPTGVGILYTLFENWKWATTRSVKQKEQKKKRHFCEKQLHNIYNTSLVFLFSVITKYFRASLLGCLLLLFVTFHSHFSLHISFHCY